MAEGSEIGRKNGGSDDGIGRHVWDSIVELIDRFVNF